MFWIITVQICINNNFRILVLPVFYISWVHIDKITDIRFGDCLWFFPAGFCCFHVFEKPGEIVIIIYHFISYPFLLHFFARSISYSDKVCGSYEPSGYYFHYSIFVNSQADSNGI